MNNLLHCVWVFHRVNPVHNMYGISSRVKHVPSIIGGI